MAGRVMGGYDGDKMGVEDVGWYGYWGGAIDIMW